MTTTLKCCPKCGHELNPENTSASDKCPACGLYFAKWRQRNNFVPPTLQKVLADEDTATPGWHDEIVSRLCFVPEEVSQLQLWGRAALLVFLAVWGWQLANMDYRDGEMGQSFMHNIVLPMHEAGHALFMPFGEFMTILGGSLFQLLLPLIVAAAQLWTNRDAFGAAVGIWWTGASLLDLAPYIYDAKSPRLIMLGGHTGEDGPHDWIYLLGEFDAVHHSQTFGGRAHTLGVIVLLLSLAAAAWVWWRWYRQAGTMRV